MPRAKKRKAVIYARFSPRPNAKDSESNKDQFALCTDYCNEKNLIIKSRHSDDAISGKEENRPGLFAALADLNQGDLLVVYKLDRLARDAYLSHWIEKEAQKVGAEIHSVKNEGTWGDTPEDELVRNILRSTDQFFRKMSARRTSESMRRKQQEGRIMTDPKRLPYGWKVKSLKDKKMERCEEEMAIVERIRELSEDGCHVSRIAKILNNERRKARTGNWTAMKIYPILRHWRIAYPYNPAARLLKPKRKG